MTVRVDGRREASATFRGGYAFARRGVIGLVLWFFRKQIAEFAIHRMTGAVVAVAIVAALGFVASTSKLHVAHRASILAEKRFVTRPTHDMSWRHPALQSRSIRHDDSKRSAKKHVRRRAQTSHYVGFGDYAVFQIMRAAHYAGLIELFVAPMLGLLGWLNRNHREAWAAEHGDGTPAYRREIEKAERRGEAEIMADDWVLDPPWRREEAKSQRTGGGRPRFGRLKDQQA